MNYEDNYPNSNDCIYGGDDTEGDIRLTNDNILEYFEGYTNTWGTVCDD